MTFEDFKTLTHVSPALTNDKLTKALTDWFQEDVSFTHWEVYDETYIIKTFMRHNILIIKHDLTDVTTFGVGTYQFQTHQNCQCLSVFYNIRNLDW